MRYITFALAKGTRTGKAHIKSFRADRDHLRGDEGREDKKTYFGK